MVAVQPHAATAQHGLERRPETLHRTGEHLGDRRAVDGGRAGTCGFAGSGEQAERCHGVEVSGQRPGRTAATLRPMATPYVTRVLAVRHGESEWNAAGRWQGHADPPLTEEGLLQAVRAAERLGTFDAVWASPLQRAAHTAAVIAEAIGVGPVQLHDDLMEAGFGPWQGLTISEIEQGWPGFLAERRRPDGAEPTEQVVARGLSALRHVAASAPGGEVLVVTHGGLVRSVCHSLDRHEVRLPNLGACWFHVRSDGQVSVGEVVSLLDGPTTGATL